MTLHLITGLANTGKTGIAYSRIRRALEVGRSPLLVLPSFADVERARRELSKARPVGLHVFTFDGLVDWLWAQQSDGRQLAEDSSREVVLRSAARTRGMPGSFAQLAGRCVAVMCDRTGEGWRTALPLVPAHAELLKQLVLDYAGHLRSGGVLHRSEASHVLSQSPLVATPDLVVLHRFTDFTESQRRLIHHLSGSSEVVVTLTRSEGFQPTAALDPLVAALAATELEVLAERVYHTGPTLEAMTSRLFSATERLEKNGEVRFSLAEGEVAQAQRIAEEVVLALDEGTASGCDEIAIAFRDVGPHFLSLKHALSEAGILVDFDCPVPLRLTAFGSAYCDLVRFGLTGDREALLNLLRSRFSPLPPDVSLELEQRWRRHGTRDTSVLIQDIRRVNIGTATWFLDLRKLSVGDMGSAAFDLLARSCRRLHANGYGGLDALATEDAATDARAHRAILSILSDCAMSGAPLALSDLLDVLRGLEVTPNEVERPDHVQVLPVTRLRGRRFETVILGGLNAGEFPAQQQEMMLPGGEVEGLLRAFGASGAPGRGPEYERMLFYEAITRAKRRLVFSACTTDADGEALRLSPFLETAADFFRDDDDDSIPADEYRRIAEPPSESDDVSARERARAAALKGEASSARVRAAIRRAAHRTGDLALEHAEAELGVSGAFSPSQIEAYLRCPYRWFHERALRPRELERTFDARNEGALAHLLLAETCSALIQEGCVANSPRTLPHALDVLESVFDAQVERLGEAQSLDERVGRRKAQAWARRILSEDAEQEDAFAVSHVEQRFGDDGVRVRIADFELHGVIDRVDVDERGRAIVVDYKRTCGTEHAAAKILSEGLVQIPLYVEAVRQALGFDVVAGLYRGLSKPAERGVIQAGALGAGRGTRTDLLGADEYEALLHDALRLASEAVERMRSLDIAPAPRTEGSCKGCGVAHTCAERRQ